MTLIFPTMEVVLIILMANNLFPRNFKRRFACVVVASLLCGVVEIWLGL